MNKILSVMPKLNVIPVQGVNPYIKSERTVEKATQILSANICRQITKGFKIPYKNKPVISNLADEFVKPQSMQDAVQVQKVKKSAASSQRGDKTSLEKYFDNMEAIEKKDVQARKFEWYEKVAKELEMKDIENQKKAELELQKIKNSAEKYSNI